MQRHAMTPYLFRLLSPFPSPFWFEGAVEETADDTQRIAQASDTLVNGTASTCLTVKTVAAPNFFALINRHLARPLKESIGHLLHSFVRLLRSRAEYGFQ